MGRTRRRYAEAPVKSGEVIEMQVDALAAGGRGVGRYKDFVVFVSRAMPGDLARVEVTRVRRKHAEGRCVQVVKKGPDTVDPHCPLVGTCGGCAWGALSYEAQARAKRQQVLDALQYIAGIPRDAVEDLVAPVIPARSTVGYRNKVEFSFTNIYEEGEDTELSGADDFETNDPIFVGVDAGFHVAGRWDQIVGAPRCEIVDKRALPARNVVVEWANRHGFTALDRTTGEGYLRNLVVRVGKATGDLIVHVVTTQGDLPKRAELVDDLEAEVPGLVGVLHTQTDSLAEVTIGDEPPEILWGKPWFSERLGGETLRVGAISFLQTNTEMADVLYETISEKAELRSDDVVWDLYCGIGSITQMIARKVESAVGVEVVDQAIEMARENAEQAGLENVEYQVGNVRPILKAAKGVWPDPSLIVLDPPRGGLAHKVIHRCCDMNPERMIYVSCNPTTFAGNLPVFAEHGWAPVSITPVDLFPHTHHVELVARLEKIEAP